MLLRFPFFLLRYSFLWIVVHCLGPLPDASQEGLLWPWKGYASVALFHYKVPEEATRATWEFASFQDQADCPSRQVHVWIQHGSYPVINASSTEEFPPHQYFVERSHMDWLTLESAYKPSETLVHPIYAPLSGSWFAVAYLEPFNEPVGFLRKPCRYSLGSIALWNKAENVARIQPYRQEQFITQKHFSYYKFYSPDDISQFSLTLSNCVSLLKHPRPLSNNQTCIEYIGLRANALPLHQPVDFQQEWRNLSANASATFIENRPYESTHYYLLVVSYGRVVFDVLLEFQHCGESGIYGPVQKEWYLNERGLVYDGKSDEDQEPNNPKEPTSGFQLFSSRSRLQSGAENEGFSLARDDSLASSVSTLVNSSAIGSGSSFSNCISKFDFTRIDNVRAFSVIYMIQGRSWYTKWLTVLEKSPIFTRFRTFDYTDLGGSLNIKVKMDTDLDKHDSQLEGFYHVVTGCVSHGRPPRVNLNKELVCDNHMATIKVANLDTEIGVEAQKIIPFPMPGVYFIGFQLSCRNFTSGKLMAECPKSSISAMVSVDVNIQPCDHRALRDACGGTGHGVCTTNHKGAFSFSSCSCAPGRRGWTCDQADPDQSKHSTLNTLLLTLSNFSFLPAIILAFQQKIYGQFMVYSATMLFSIFYHACDQESFSGSLPRDMQTMCLNFYVNNEVLQFCDFFSAILSFWVTVVSLSSLPAEITNGCNLFGALLVAFLVQYNRTGRLVLLIPVPLGLFVLTLSLAVKMFKRKKWLTYPSRRGLMIYGPAIMLLLSACTLATVAGNDQNYPYVHSAWHVLIALALAFLVLRCERRGRRKLKVSSSSSQDSRPSSSVCASNENIESDSRPITITAETFLEMPPPPQPSTSQSVQNNVDNNGGTVPSSLSSQSPRKNPLTKGLSYLQNFSALLARHDEVGS